MTASGTSGESSVTPNTAGEHELTEVEVLCESLHLPIAKQSSLAMTGAARAVISSGINYNRRTGTRVYPASLQNDIGSGWGSTESTEQSKGL